MRSSPLIRQLVGGDEDEAQQVPLLSFSSLLSSIPLFPFMEALHNSGQQINNLSSVNSIQMEELAQAYAYANSLQTRPSMQQHSFPAFSQPAVPTSLPMAGAGAGAGGAWPSALLANTPSTSGVPPPQAHQLAGEGARDAQQLAQLVSILSSAKAANDAAVQHQQQQAQALMQAQASADLVSVLREIVRSGQTTSVRHLEHVLQGMMIARAKEAATATAMQQLLSLLVPSNQQALGLIDPGNLQQNLGLLLGAAAQGGGDTITLASPPLAQRMTSAQPQAQPNSKRMRLSDFITPQTSTPMSLSNFSPPLPPPNGAASAAAAGAPGVPPPPPPPPVFNRPARIRVGNKSRTKFRTFQ